MSEDAATAALLECCSARRWAATVAAGRPYGSVGELLDRSWRAVSSLAEADLLEALAGHPRIGDRLTGQRGADWSAREQAGVNSADGDMLRRLREGNAAYEERFGHIYLACASGRSAGELLDLLTGRLDNDRQAEWRVVAEELAKINRLRLEELAGGVA